MDLKAPLTFQEQLKKLEEHGMKIENPEYAVEILSQINYYRFTGYTLQFRQNSDNSNFSNEIYFSHIYNIYKFDECLRDIFRKYIEKTEVYYRTQIAYHFSVAKCTKPPYDQHYDENNFYNKTGYKEVMDSFKKEKNYYKDSLIVKHHKLKYNSKIPLWVIVELMSFSNISKLYNSMYITEKDAISTSVGTGRNTLENHLHCLAVLRNKCSHAARLYNTEMNPPAKFSTKFLQKNPDIKNNSLFAYILVLLKRLPNPEFKKALINDINTVIEQYNNYIDLSLLGFPTNYTDILKNNL